jgi:RNA polymerase sigma factor, sigma-70 family/RNA polymerase sigma-70 factor, sigma-E family
METDLPGDAWEALFEGDYDRLARFCLLLSGSQDTAQDLAQEAFVRAAPRLEGLSEGHARGYLRRTATNIWRNRLRRAALERKTANKLDRQEVDDFARVETADEIGRALAKLPTRQRACLILRYYEDLKESEIADSLGISVGTVKSQCSRGLARLRRELVER